MSRRDDFRDVAKSVPFDNSSNGFTSTDAQAAIEEATILAQGFPRAGVRSCYNGTIGNNDWLGPSELLPNTPLLVSPVTLIVKEITWANATANVQFRIQFRSNSKTGSIFYTLTVVPSNSGHGFVTGVNFTLNPGDTIWAQYLDDGQNCSDMDLIIWVARVS